MKSSIYGLRNLEINLKKLSVPIILIFTVVWTPDLTSMCITYGDIDFVIFAYISHGPRPMKAFKYQLLIIFKN
jgi:hypothetical protein